MPPSTELEFDPDRDGPPPADAGIFGLDIPRDQAIVIVIPAPFEATVSYRTGTAAGPEAVRQASHQIDLFDLDAGDLEVAMVHLAQAPLEIETHNGAARADAEKVIAALVGQRAVEATWVDEVNRRCVVVHDALEGATEQVFESGQLPCVLGGDHSVALGPIRAAARRHSGETVGVLQVDAHADLRDAYEGFTHSHASVMHNVLAETENVTLVQVGIRDVSAPEIRRAETDDRIHLVSDRALRRPRLSGTVIDALAAAVDTLPERVWWSIDIDGLDPALCPHTGTPVPGGLSFDECVVLLELVVDSGREVIGMDLCEVAPGPVEAPNAEWDATVGARLLAKMCGLAVRSRKGVS